MVKMNRRDFGVSLAVAGALPAVAGPSVPARKALIRGLPTEETLMPVKAAEFNGIECNVWDVSAKEAEQARLIADRLDMKVHSVLRGWTSMTEVDGVAESIASVEKALQTAALLGADAILLVPGRTKIKPIPKPWEFDIEFDAVTAEVSRVVPRDNSRFQDYIDIQNGATVCSREALQRLAPIAEKHGVVIAVENVWNNFWVKPDLFAAYLHSCDSPWIQAYLDLGNHVKYAPTEAWIQALDGLIAKCHVKDFKLKPDGKGGSFVDVRDGSVNWPSVMKELDRVGYHGWMTIEGSGKLPIEEQSRRLDLILGGA